MIFYGIGVVTVSIVGAAILGVAIDEFLWFRWRRQLRLMDEQQREYRKGR